MVRHIKKEKKYSWTDSFQTFFPVPSQSSFCLFTNNNVYLENGPTNYIKIFYNAVHLFFFFSKKNFQKNILNIPQRLIL